MEGAAAHCVIWHVLQYHYRAWQKLVWPDKTCWTLWSRSERRQGKMLKHPRNSEVNLRCSDGNYCWIKQCFDWELFDWWLAKHERMTLNSPKRVWIGTVSSSFLFSNTKKHTLWEECRSGRNTYYWHAWMSLLFRTLYSESRVRGKNEYSHVQQAGAGRATSKCSRCRDSTLWINFLATGRSAPRLRLWLIASLLTPCQLPVKTNALPMRKEKGRRHGWNQSR